MATKSAQIVDNKKNVHITYGTFPKMPETLAVSNETLEWFSLSSIFNTSYKSIEHSNDVNDKPSVFTKFFY